MTDQLDLFAPRPGLARRDHPDTSRAAALRVMPRTGTQRRLVYECLRGAREWGLTDGELQQALTLPGNSERPRRIELVAAGWVIDSGVRRDGAIVWTALLPPEETLA